MDLHETAVVVPGVEGAARIFAGQTQACALTKDGRVRCWGSNTQGELGIGKQSSDERAGDVKGIAGVADVCMASMHACARTEGGALYCWGGNVAGQVGDGTEERRLLPTRIQP
jgi:alpha-tubulin suppressor-like RCC1 family protein